MESQVDLARYRDSQTALHVAVQSGHTDVVKSLARMAFINATDDKDRTPFHIAIRKNNQELVDLLLDADTDVHIQDSEQRSPLSIASEQGHESLLTRLQEQATKQQLRQSS